MVIKSYHIILAVKILGWFLLKWAGFGELLGWKSSTRSGNTGSSCTPHELKRVSRLKTLLKLTGEAQTRLCSAEASIVVRVVTQDEG